MSAMRKLLPARPAPITPNWMDVRDELPAGPPSDNLDRVVAILERETNSDGLHGRLVDLGWSRPDGTPIEWWQHQLFRR